MVLVIIILVAWAVILGPGLIRRRARGGSDQSITHFHYQLRVLENSAPEPIVAPAYRLRSVDGNGSPTGICYPDSGKPPVLTVVGAKELPRPALAFLGEPAPDDGTAAPDVREFAPDGQSSRAESVDRPVAAIDRGRDPRDRWDPEPPTPSGITEASVPRGPGTHGVDTLAREVARRRRRDTLTVLAVVFVSTLLLGVVTGSTVMWGLCAFDGVALVAYVSVMIHLRRMAVERERKLRYLEPRSDDRRGQVRVPTTHVSGRYAHPSNQQAIAR